jgi:hypothetical protein
MPPDLTLHHYAGRQERPPQEHYERGLDRRQALLAAVATASGVALARPSLPAFAEDISKGPTYLDPAALDAVNAAFRKTATKGKVSGCRVGWPVL